MNAFDYWSIAQGALATVVLSVASIVLGVPLGLGLALIRWARVPLLNRVVVAYVSLIRSCPAVTLTLLIFFALPQFGISLDPTPAAILALTISTAAFNCEIWRAALINFPRDQYDAALAFAMPRTVRLRRIVMPQIWRASLPGLVNEMTLQIKSTPAVAVIGIVEITRAALRVGARTYDPLPPFIFALLLYGLVVFVLIKAQRVIERRQPEEARA
ncbi:MULTISPECIES: amino acid ABC transporter permease [Paraburkholderia]|jgi:His/Glu/Gln/Arg/opine family amino acid ABC transporter permease subunit|uniref:Amino acid ABC transporter permease n=1 Tax=Paraburkholderia largidicola TaxID=3014751 RepID=A0A7I8BZL6_9BURK|nr:MULTISPECIES: amino acid ABC transporter permease [Paraburkholderia]BEU26917.1 amino acid ABC transporter permease [Paraburkholderia sp. 22B1P]GJH32047.1 ABC transporter permease subunit [Paraburkholderia hospita]CAG9264667.1 ABC transporter permease [Paraburkholderia caribensis]BCF93739.1 amino acid ABC transporter permease [Paraburkholderia sp. PGU16]GJH00436.1 ABC transporter permease subunit [Paraburkholderia terrae]